MELSVVILAKTDTPASHEMTMACIDSLMASEPQFHMQVMVVESNRNFYNSGFVFPDFVKVIIPESDFNFHKFLNIGIAASTGNFIALCNNDLIFHRDWFSEIYKVAQKHPGIGSFSPSGIPCDNSQKGTFELGYRVMIHIKGWCIVAKKEVFQKTGPLDEKFTFYYADNDYGMTLKSHNIPHALVYCSYVEHLERKRIPKTGNGLANEFLKKYRLPDYFKHEENYHWMLDDEMALQGFLAYHDKWGAPRFLYRKNKLADFLIRYNLGRLVRFFIKIKF
jgi:GT2 family glycosyltransferase